MLITIMEVLTVMIFPSQYNQSEVQSAMKEELQKLKMLDAYEEVDNVGQECDSPTVNRM